MNYIDKIYYINLDKRIDRKKIMEEQFNKFNIINYERVSAICPFFNKKYDNDFIDSQIEIFLNNKLLVNDLIDGYDIKYILDLDKNYIKSKSKINRRKYILGALGCKMSHIKIYKKAKNYNNILILEDDALFHDNFNEHFSKLINNIKDIDYDMVWLAPNWLYKNNNGILNRCYSYKYINENFALVNSSKSIDGRFGSTNNTAGQIVSNNCIQFILKNFEDSKQSEIDLWYRINIQIKNKVYTTIPNLIRQRVEESNIENFKVNYDKDIHYRTRQKFNIFTIVKENDKDIYLENLKNNLQKMIGYEKIYYISNKELFNYDILHFINIDDLEDNIELLKNNFSKKVNDNNIKYFYYMDFNLKLVENYFPFDENNVLVKNKNFYLK
jgi:GR25 family glycosyltransferase involved in LPS biosynthesis